MNSKSQSRRETSIPYRQSLPTCCIPSDAHAHKTSTPRRWESKDAVQYHRCHHLPAELERVPPNRLTPPASCVTMQRSAVPKAHAPCREKTTQCSRYLHMVSVCIVLQGDTTSSARASSTLAHHPLLPQLFNVPLHNLSSSFRFFGIFATRTALSDRLSGSSICSRPKHRILPTIARSTESSERALLAAARSRPYSIVQYSVDHDRSVIFSDEIAAGERAVTTWHPNSVFEIIANQPPHSGKRRCEAVRCKNLAADGRLT